MKARVISLFALILTITCTALAADVTGKWIAQVPGRNGETHETAFNLKADGAQLTGTMTTQRGEQQISDGKIDGDTVSFSVVMNFNGNQMKFLYKGKVAGDQIQFTRQREGGDRTQEFTAKRSS